MNEEEKKAIEDMNRFANGIDMSCVTARQMQIILNLVEKLQKENKELKDFKKQVTDIESTNFIKYKNYISVQKVKDEIEELNQYYKKEIYPSLYQWGDITITEHYDEMIGLLQEIIGDK